MKRTFGTVSNDTEFSHTPPVSRSSTWPKCCLCGAEVESNGSCLACQRWPINVHPIRPCRVCQTHVEPDGFCKRCACYTATRLEPGNAEWVDTGKVSQLIDRQSNKERMGELAALMERVILKHQPTTRNLAEEKRRILAEHPAEELVPF